MNNAFNKQIHALLAKANVMEQKAAIVSSFSNGRTQSSRELSHAEAFEMVKWLLTQVTDTTPCSHKMRRKIISMAHQMHWHLPGTQQVDMPRLNTWCNTFGFGKKKLNDYTYAELPKLVTQFTFVYNEYISGL